LEDAHGELHQSIMRQRATANMRVGEMLTAWGAPDEALDRLVDQAAQLGRKLHYSDGVCEVRLHLPAGKVMPALREALRLADPRRPLPALDAALDAGILVAGCALPGTGECQGAAAGWKHAAQPAREQALEAARLDARLALVERIRKLRLGP